MRVRRLGVAAGRAWSGRPATTCSARAGQSARSRPVVRFGTPSRGGAVTGARPGWSAQLTAESRRRTTAGLNQVSHAGRTLAAGWTRRSSLLTGGGGWGIRTREGVNPTRFPSVRHRPLGESSASEHSRVDARRSTTALHSSPDPARRPSCELPQGRKAARVNGLWRVRGVRSCPGPRPRGGRSELSDPFGTLRSVSRRNREKRAAKQKIRQRAAAPRVRVEPLRPAGPDPAGQLGRPPGR